MEDVSLSDDEESVVVNRRRIRKADDDDSQFASGEGLSGGEAGPDEFVSSSDDESDSESSSEGEWSDESPKAPKGRKRKKTSGAGKRVAKNNRTTSSSTKKSGHAWDSKGRRHGKKARREALRNESSSRRSRRHDELKARGEHLSEEAMREKVSKEPRVVSAGHYAHTIHRTHPFIRLLMIPGWRLSFRRRRASARRASQACTNIARFA